MRRRRYLGTTAGAAVAALAGCFGNAETNNPRSVVRAYLEAEHDGDSEEMADLLHSDSPLDPTAGDIESRGIEIGEITVEQKDLSEGDIGSLNMQLSAETADTIGNQENALVEANYEVEPPETDGGGVSGRVSVQTTYLTAMEGEEWFVVAFEVL